MENKSDFEPVVFKDEQTAKIITDFATVEEFRRYVEEKNPGHIWADDDNDRFYNISLVL